MPGAKSGAQRDSGASSGGQRTAGLVLGGFGIVGLGVGTYFAFERKSNLDDRDGVCPSLVNCTRADLDRNAALTDDAKSATTFSYVGFGAGAALMVAGAVLYLTAPKKPEQSAKVALTPWLDASNAGVGVRGAW